MSVALGGWIFLGRMNKEKTAWVVSESGIKTIAFEDASLMDGGPDILTKLEFDAAAPKESMLDFGECFELRTIPGDESEFAIPPFWARSRLPIEDDPLIQAATLTFLSDLGPVPAALPPGVPLRRDLGFAASLDHAIWFHRPFHPDRWHRYEVRSVNHNDSRGLAVGSLYAADGTLIASTTQEALWRM